MQNVNVAQQMGTGQEKLSFFTKVSYGLGEFAASVVWSLVSSYLLFFYTDVFGLPGAAVAILLLVARVWDVVVDPVLGLIMERTNTKHGRFRPYILYGAIFLGIFNVLTFYTPSFTGVGKIIYAGVTYLLLGTFHSMVNVPYGALATVMSRSTDERTSLNSFRGFFGTMAGILTGAAVMPIIQVLGGGNNQRGYFYAAIVLSVVSMPMLFLTFKNCKEVITPEKEERPSVKESLHAVVSNKPLLIVFASLFILFTGLFQRLGTLVYYCIYALGRPDLIAVLFTLLSVCMAIGSFIPPIATKYIEKKTLLQIGLTITGLGFGSLYFVPATNVTMIIALSFIACVPLGFNGIMIFSMTADCIDDNQVKTGLRSDGAIYSFTSLITKISNALVGTISVASLGLVGYVANAQQTPEAITGINAIVNLVPGIMFLIAVIPMFFYKITKAKADENSRILIERHNKSGN
jgi:GPH family glycoside/pentoside/hexuronide:cation symporter/probable glucitol transport protein GutA